MVSDSLWRAPAAAERLRATAVAFLAALDPEQRAAATAPFDVADHRVWTYLPGPRPGLALSDMTEAQRTLAMELLDAGLSKQGGTTARGIMSLEAVLRDLEREDGLESWRGRDPLYFWFRVLGDPSDRAPWAWRANGHHLAVHLTVVGDEIAVTPQFFGANPAVAPRGPHAGLRTLPGEEDLARDLLATLDEPQRAQAITLAVAPDDILTRRDPAANPEVVPTGVAFGQLQASQRELLVKLIRYYLDRVLPDAADASWRGVTDAGLDAVTFAWAGSEDRGKAHYYAVRGPTFLLEYDNSQNNANHIHTVWRDLRHDWGEDLLAAHYAAHPHH